MVIKKCTLTNLRCTPASDFYIENIEKEIVYKSLHSISFLGGRRKVLRRAKMMTMEKALVIPSA